MRRENQVPRADWRKRCEDAGFFYHSVGGTYWDETACYAFSAEQVDRLEEVTAELQSMCLEATAEIVHHIDCKDDKFGRREAGGIASLVQGIVAAHDDDAARLERGAAMMDDLYATFGGA